jgi:5-methylcytosine-specific restriction protein A
VTLKPCLICNEPCTGPRCPTHRGYSNYAWTRLSKRARKLQPWCSDCGSTEDLQCDHSEAAWAAYAAGKPIKLSMIDVVCAACNRARGSSRPESAPRGEPPANTVPRLPSRAARYTPPKDGLAC